MSKRTVYLVSSGSYSDYHVDAVFSTREAAEAAIATANARRREAADLCGVVRGSYFDRDEYEIEEKPLDVWTQDLSGAFEVWITDSGAVKYADWEVGQSPTGPAIVVAPVYGAERYFLGFGETAEHARRSAEELRRVTLTEPAMPEGA
jgi:hypothetical protein